MNDKTHRSKQALPNTVDVLCVGASSYDVTLEVDEHPLPDVKTEARSLTGCGGGPAANAAVAVARLGRSAAFVGYLGEDTYGELHWKELQDAGVQTDWVKRGHWNTPYSVILAKPNGERSLINYNERTASLTASHVDFSTLQPRVVLLDGHEPELAREGFRWAKSIGATTVLDAGSVRPGTSELATQVDYLVASEKFALGFTEKTSVPAALQQLSSQCRSVVITLGARGLIWNQESMSGELPAFCIQSVDTTGAGDAFHGAFCVGLVEGLSWLELLSFSSAAAALCCKKVGARLGLANRDEVNAFLGEVNGKVNQ